MSKYRVQGGQRLSGEILIGGAKNACLAILPAVVLSDDVCRIGNIPNISDALLSLDILEALGAKIRRVDRSTVDIDPRPIHTHVVPHELARHMRASYYFLGALLGRFGEARVSMPGGCNFGVRPIDQHLKGFTKLGATVPAVIENGMIDASAPQLIGNSIYFDVVSVGATINVMLAAVKARGITILENSAKEPHVVDVANFLNSMGADIRGAGTDIIKICGVPHLHGAEYSIIPDQIEAGTYMACAVATGGDLLLHGVIPKHLESISAKFEEMGALITEDDDAIRVQMEGAIHACNLKTMPHPGFPTDMQPQASALLACADGTSIVTENVWDNRFRYVDELRRMGAQATVDGKVAVFQGVPFLTGAPVRAVDLRAGAAMMIAALAAHGQTEIEDIQHIERGYENFVEKLHGVGADICRIDLPDSMSRRA
ncbi:MAG: UDP-N-acetylglucosamine 1-carboxyvinyltransferase [Clostridia bacterium]|nr:UDP-N-acetylglucosamine 1-carboxyvinyltransferase [Clostridia bacterium]